MLILCMILLIIILIQENYWLFYFIQISNIYLQILFELMNEQRIYSQVICIDDSEEQININNKNENNIFQTSCQVYCNSQQDRKALDGLYQDAKKRAIQIYQFTHKDSSNTLPKISRCKLCTKKVQDDQNRFKCIKCKKSCHYSCMQIKQQCPRCRYNLSSQKFNKETGDKQLKIKKRKTINIDQFVTIEQAKDEDESLQNKKLVQPTHIIEPMKIKLPVDTYQEEINQFINLYPFHLTEDGSIKLPIDAKLFNKYHFVRFLLKQKSFSIPTCKILPLYFEKVLVVWNHFCFFGLLIEPNQISQLSLQIFEDQLKTYSISYFLVPLLGMMIQPYSRGSSPLLKIFQDLKELKLFRCVGRYFWPGITLELLSVIKQDKQEDSPIIQKLRLMAEKRIYEADDLTEKLQILSFLVQIAFKSPNTRVNSTEMLKKKFEANSDLLKQFDARRAKLKTRQKVLNQNFYQLSDKIQKLRQPSFSQKSEKSIQLLKKLEKQKHTISFEQDQVRQEKKQLLQQKKVIQFLFEFECCNKIIYLGQDRSQRMYWFIINTEANDIIFVNFMKQKNVTSSEWGYYEGTSSILALTKTLNVAIIQEQRLKNNIERMIQNHIINSQTKGKSVKDLYRTHFYRESEEQTVSQRNGKKFLEENIKQINLSELRKLMVESHRIFADYLSNRSGSWKIKDFYWQRTRNEKFRNLAEIKNFILELASSMYMLSDSKTQKKGKGREKRGSQLWKGRGQVYGNWKKMLQGSNKNSEVFMFMLIFYLEVVHCCENQKGNNIQVKDKKESMKIKGKRAVPNQISQSQSEESSSQNEDNSIS